ncbi:MAG: hypothetical protein KDA91_18185 [Planctomycetaceae bacterium]|nr:hypothetical protein [Planctomycetaceae bacterium]
MRKTRWLPPVAFEAVNMGFECLVANADKRIHCWSELPNNDPHNGVAGVTFDSGTRAIGGLWSSADFDESWCGMDPVYSSETGPTS